jgi:hypothetical protein
VTRRIISALRRAKEAAVSDTVKFYSNSGPTALYLAQMLMDSINEDGDSAAQIEQLQDGRVQIHHPGCENPNVSELPCAACNAAIFTLNDSKVTNVMTPVEEKRR